jgi:hypothetical protein
MADKLQEVIRYNGSVATRAEAAEGLLLGGVPFAWVIRYLSDSPTLSSAEFQREAKPKDRVRFSARFNDQPREQPREDDGRFAAAGNAGGNPAPRPAHEMTAGDFARTLPGRVTRTPAVGVHEWARAQGREADLAWDKSDTNVADLIGGLLTRGSRQQKGHAKVLARQLGKYNALYRDYEAAVKSGQIPQTETVTPLDTVASAADAAYVRAMHKRAIYKAIGAGLTVPAPVLAEYPGLTDRAAVQPVIAAGKGE